VHASARTESSRRSAPADMGEVYKARDAKLDRLVAIKVIGTDPHDDCPSPRADRAEGACKTIEPADRAGAMVIMNTVMSPDGKSYAYALVRILSQLYVVTGLR
jgi:hypothetical protein